MAKYPTLWHFGVCKHITFNNLPREVVHIISITRIMGPLETPCRGLALVFMLKLQGFLSFAKGKRAYYSRLLQDSTMKTALSPMLEHSMCFSLSCRCGKNLTKAT